MLNQIHPDAALCLIGRGLLVRDEGLEAYIGRDVRYRHWVESLGTQARDHSFRIVGVQLDWKGKRCWRGLCNDGHDAFGRVIDPDEVELVELAKS